MISEVRDIVLGHRDTMFGVHKGALLCLGCLIVNTINAGAGRSIDHKVDLPTKLPLNIGHRGSSGMLPEHTKKAYQLAIDQGADIIECDVTVTKDLKLICLHESWLNATTDVWEKFSSRVTKRFVNSTFGGKWVEDVFSVDLTISEIKKLRVNQRFSFRNPEYNGQYQIVTLEEYINVAKSAGRPIGIYVEVKNPRWVNSLDILNSTTFEDLILDVLHKHGYTSRKHACFVQSFDEESIRYMSNRTQLPITKPVTVTGKAISDADLARWATFCYGIAANKRLIVEVQDNKITRKTDLVQRAHKHGLMVHAYTFRNEFKFLPWDYGQDPYNEYDQLIVEMEVDGLFTDFPWSLAKYLNATYREVANGATNVHNWQYLLFTVAMLQTVAVYLM